MQTNYFFYFVVLVALCTACDPDISTHLAEHAIVPAPVQVEEGGEAFLLRNGTVLYTDVQDSALLHSANYLKAQAQALADIELEVKPTGNRQIKRGIALQLLDGEDESLGKEGYRLTMDKRRVLLQANTAEGVFRGTQTFLQILHGAGLHNDSRIIPTGTITDYPAYAWRGMMLDVARHFFPPATVKRLIDQLAIYKINTLHLHLADDQGWRIEIKSWPRLAQHGGSTQVGGGKGGYYTQEEYRDLVAYAASRFITVIPEIDMPGHTNAALASYPALNCNGVTPALYTGTNVGFSTLCTDKDTVYQFVRDIVRELAAITPGPYLHIGGDESHATEHEDYISFIDSVQQIVAAAGKTMVGWDEIAQASIQPGTVVQYWASAENAQLGASKGASILLSPATKTYLDMQYDSTSRIGLHWAAYIEVDSAYLWDPATIAKVDPAKILGIESPLWTETVVQEADIDYLVFPRIVCHAELGWTPAPTRSWAVFRKRLASHEALLERMGVAYYRSGHIWEAGK